ncbi:MAG: DNA repair protein RadC [Flavobacteriales bacterium]|nr:DNA repair protein RadC [Flavobacteriales bacterium]
MLESLSIKAWAEDDRPREKLASLGRSALSDAELVAIIIGSGSPKESAVELSKRILHSIGNNLSELGRVTIADLMKFKGIGEAKAITIVAALELGRRRKENEPKLKPKIATSKDAFDVIFPVLADLPHEEFWVILLNQNNKVIAISCISRGGVSGTVADAKLIFKVVLEKLASSVILSHNHPSGNLKPSKSDIDLTKKLKAGGKLLDIAVLDHLIIGDSDYYSFADEGII